jgi:hypothetical protein
MKKYSVEFLVYQYNSGTADNGTFMKSVGCDSLEEAESVKNNIDKVFEFGDCYGGDHEDVIWVSELIFTLTPCGGFLKSKAEIYSITKTKI